MKKYFKYVYYVILIVYVFIALYHLYNSGDLATFQNNPIYLLGIFCLFPVWLAFESLSLFLIFDHKIKYKEILKIYLIGEGYNRLTPFGGYGGDPLRVLMLSKKIEKDKATKGVICFKLIDAFVASLFGLLCTSLYVYNFEIHDYAVLTSLKLMVSLFVIVTVFSLLVIFIPHFLKKSRFLSLKSLGLSPIQLIRNIIIQLCSRSYRILEIAFILYVFNVQINVEILICILSCLSIGTVFFFFVPGGLGTEDTLVYTAMNILGLSVSLGIAIVLYKRLTSITWSLIGICLHIFYFKKDD